MIRGTVYPELGCSPSPDRAAGMPRTLSNRAIERKSGVSSTVSLRPRIWKPKIQEVDVLRRGIVCESPREVRPSRMRLGICDDQIRKPIIELPPRLDQVVRDA